MKTTAIYPNRIEDKNELEKKFPLLAETGNPNLEFWSNGILIAKGYDRVVYGDHGPYIEFSKDHIKAQLFGKFNKFDFNKIPRDLKFYYLWLTVKNTSLKIYYQLKTVQYLKNAPPRDDGKPSRFNREEGYADYKVDKLYISPYEFKIGELKY